MDDLRMKVMHLLLETWEEWCDAPPVSGKLAESANKIISVVLEEAAEVADGNAPLAINDDYDSGKAHASEDIAAAIRALKEGPNG